MPNHMTEYSLQYLVNLLLDKSVDPPMMRIALVAKAVDGPNAGSYMDIKAVYNETTGNYELLTAGSGTTSTTNEGIGYWTIETDFVVS